MVWKGSGSKIPEKLRQKIFERDNWECQLRYEGICIGLAQQVDHIRNLASLGLPRGHNEESNLASACIPCHRRKSSYEGLAAQGRLKTKRTLTPPGLAGSEEYTPTTGAVNASAKGRPTVTVDAAHAEAERLRRLAAELDDESL